MIKTEISRGTKIITMAAFGIATTSVGLPLVAHYSNFPLNIIWPDFIAIGLLAAAAYLFRKHKIEKNPSTILGCHLLLCATMVTSNIVWVGIPFVDLLMLLSANIFGFGFIIFAILLLSAFLLKKLGYQDRK